MRVKTVVKLAVQHLQEPGGPIHGIGLLIIDQYMQDVMERIQEYIEAEGAMLNQAIEKDDEILLRILSRASFVSAVLSDRFSIRTNVKLVKVFMGEYAKFVLK